MNNQAGGALARKICDSKGWKLRLFKLLLLLYLKRNWQERLGWATVTPVVMQLSLGELNARFDWAGGCSIHSPN